FAIGAMMQAVVYEGIPFQMTVQDVPMPTILDPTDAIVRITMSSICGSDLHVYNGVVGGAPPWIMGHEAVGYIEDIGDGVSSLRKGEYVVIPDAEAHGKLDLSPDTIPYYGFGFPGLSRGLQGTDIIPKIFKSCDYLTLSDVFATGWAGLDFAGFQPGDSVAVFGAGPVGLLAAYSAILRGASTVYVVDHLQDRLDLATAIGAVPINFVTSDPVAHILALEPKGVMRSVECVGMEALNDQLEIQEDVLMKQLVDVTHIGGGIGFIGVFAAQESSPGAPLGSTIAPNVSFPFSSFWAKNLSLRGGGVDAKLYAAVLRDLVEIGKAHPGFIGSALIKIDQVPQYYERFRHGEEIKVFIRFP
ncbi:hypothetical protein B0T10DRAFT_579936, partial [Thelonectria olida]